MNRTQLGSKQIVPFSAPEARRTLAGDAITGNHRAMNSRPEGTQDLNAGPALLPERENYLASVPAVSPQANFRRASGAEELGGVR